LLTQTFDDWEMVIVDDGSTDDSALISEEVMRSHPKRRMRLIRQENRGAPSARNTGIHATKGRYILPLDTDDVIAPEMLEATVAVLDEHADVAIAYTDPFLFVDDAVTPIPYLPRRNTIRDSCSNSASCFTARSTAARLGRRSADRRDDARRGRGLGLSGSPAPNTA